MAVSVLVATNVVRKKMSIKTVNIAHQMWFALLLRVGWPRSGNRKGRRKLRLKLKVKRKRKLRVRKNKRMLAMMMTSSLAVKLR